MPITPTNQVKNSVSPTGIPKYGVWLWGDVLATWGDTLATWGNLSITPVNQTKNSISGVGQLKS